jgi:hypothetical protein
VWPGSYVKSAEFRSEYFEQQPLLLTVPPPAGSNGERVPPLNQTWGLRDVIMGLVPAAELETPPTARAPVKISLGPKPGSILVSGLGGAQVLAQAKAGGFIYLLPNQYGHHRSVRFATNGFHRYAKGFEFGMPIGKKEISAAIREGHTVIMNGAQLWSPAVAGLAQALTEAFGRMTSVNAYVTGGGVPVSLAPHNDIQVHLHCSTVVQRWCNVVRPLFFSAPSSSSSKAASAGSSFRGPTSPTP